MTDILPKHKKILAAPRIHVSTRPDFIPRIGSNQPLCQQHFAEMVEAVNHVIDTGLDPLDLLEYEYLQLQTGTAGFFDSMKTPAIGFINEERAVLIIENCFYSNYMARGNFPEEPPYKEVEQFESIEFYFENSPINEYRLRLTRIQLNHTQQH